MPTVSSPHENLVRDTVALGHDHGQWTRPERVCKQLRLRRNRRTQVVNPVKVRDMDDQRVILRTAFREENFLYRLAVQRIRRKAVHGFGRHADHLARSNEFCGGFTAFSSVSGVKELFSSVYTSIYGINGLFFHFGDDAVSRQRDVYRTFTMLYSIIKKGVLRMAKTRTFSSRSPAFSTITDVSRSRLAISSAVPRSRAIHYDSDAIRAFLPYIGKVGYIANSPQTKAGGTESASRIYERVPKRFTSVYCSPPAPRSSAA